MTDQYDVAVVGATGVGIHREDEPVSVGVQRGSATVKMGKEEHCCFRIRSMAETKNVTKLMGGDLRDICLTAKRSAIFPTVCKDEIGLDNAEEGLFVESPAFVGNYGVHSRRENS